MHAAVPKYLVVATDLGEQSAQVVRAAQALAAPLGGRITVVHVLEPTPTPPGLEAFALEGMPLDWEQRLLTARLDAASQRMRDLTQTCADARVPLETNVLIGTLPKTLVETLVEELSRLGADLLVVGTHGRKGVARFFLGSVAERLMRAAPCPVLVVRPEPAAS